MVSIQENQTQEQQQQQQQPQETQNDYKLINRVINYPTVSNLWETANYYYSAAKEKNTYVKKGCESLEFNLDHTMKYLVTPVMENELVQKISTPVFSSVDDFGCKQLDKLEKFSETVQPTVAALKEKANSIIETSAQSIEPIDQFLNTSVIGTPIKLAVVVSESVVDRFIPEKQEKVNPETNNETTSTSTVSPGPIRRGTQVAKRLQREALSKLNNLNLRDDITKNGFVHVVDLIQYAAKNFDSASKVLKDEFESKSAKIQEITKDARTNVDQKVIIGAQVAKDKAQELTKEAVDALYSAIKILSAHIPESVTKSSQSLIEKSTQLSSQLENVNLSLFQNLANISTLKLQEASSLISNSVQSSEISVQMLEKARTTIEYVIQNFSSVRDYTKAYIFENSPKVALKI